jgi:hypothetical protein
MARRRIMRGRVRRHRSDAGPQNDQDGLFVEIEPGELRDVFASPGWLRDLGTGVDWTQFEDLSSLLSGSTSCSGCS